MLLYILVCVIFKILRFSKERKKKRVRCQCFNNFDHHPKPALKFPAPVKVPLPAGGVEKVLTRDNLSADELEGFHFSFYKDSCSSSS